jgi:DNA polymerase (family 10)
LDNTAIARILGEIADLLEIKGDNPFKIRAYRNVADIAAITRTKLATLDETALREIPGIGKDLAERSAKLPPPAMRNSIASCSRNSRPRCST